jgi:lysophospholipase L1-like esterase
MPLATVCLTLLPFGILETVLRVFAPQSMEDVAVDPYVDLQQLEPLFQLDASTKEWKIPQHRMNFFRPAMFSAKKKDTTKRIFVLGGSTVQGRPFSTETAFPIWLEMRLRAAFPKTDFEVVNVGGISYASYRVSKLVNEVLEHKPDAIVLYTGHNEFLEDREYGALLEAGPFRTWLSSMSGNIRTVSWLQERFNPDTKLASQMPTEVDARLDHVGGLEKYRRDPAWRDGVEQHFDSAFLTMVKQIKKAEIPLWICVPTCDLVNTPPFKVELANELSEAQRAKWQQNWAKATDDQSPPLQRLAACQQCLSIDPLDAGAHYVAGRLFYEQGDTRMAKEHLTLAKDLDVCPLRATTIIEQSVVNISTQENIPIILTPTLFDERDSNGNRLPDGIADPRLFVDHLHPSIKGHQMLGTAVADSMLQNELFAELPSPPGMPLLEQRYQTLSNQHLAGLSEAYYARGKQRLEGLRLWAAGRAGQLPEVKQD